jgi:transcriptional regulator with XRE-family HTH domain
MGGVAFGQTLKHLREKAKISSKSLSIQAGKAATYVSQLERGLIKNPNYDTCHKLLEFIGVESDSIEQMLNKHGLISDLNIFIEDIERINRSEPSRKESPRKAEKNSRIYEEKYRDTKEKNDYIFSIFSILVDTDITRASVVINNLYKLIQDEDNLDFLCGVLSLDYTHLPSESKAEILARLRKWF